MSDKDDEPKDDISEENDDPESDEPEPMVKGVDLPNGPIPESSPTEATIPDKPKSKWHFW